MAKTREFSNSKQHSLNEIPLREKRCLKLRHDAKWSREEQAGADNGSADNPPFLFTALEEQLGLKLVPAKGSVTRLVVDSIETPAID